MCLSTAVQAAKRFAASTTDVGVGTVGRIPGAYSDVRNRRQQLRHERVASPAERPDLWGETGRRVWPAGARGTRHQRGP